MAVARDATLVLESELTCPLCLQVSREVMPTDACQFFYQCRHCKVVLRPEPGHCCVFCSYGSMRCPPMQGEGSCCARQVNC